MKLFKYLHLKKTINLHSLILGLTNGRTWPWGFFRTCHLNTYTHEMM